MGKLFKGILQQVAKEVVGGALNATDEKVDGAIDQATDKVVDNLFDKIGGVLDALGGAKGENAPAAENGEKAESAQAAPTPEEIEKKTQTDPADNRRKAKGGSKSNYMNQLADEWNSQKEEGYVWTVNISDTAKMGALGMVDVIYRMNVSCSHVGTDPMGVYRGSMGFSYSADYSGLSTLFSALAGGFSADNGGWFKNDNFLMRLVPYTQEDEVQFIGTLGPAGMNEQEEALSNAMGNAVMAAHPVSERTDEPLGYWCDWEYRMTEGDMSNHVKAVLYGGLAGGHAELDNDGHSLTSEAHATFPFVGSFHDHRADIIDSPFPYHLKMYPDGQVILDLYGTGSSTVFIRFKGTWDKIPVEDTFVVGEE